MTGVIIIWGGEEHTMMQLGRHIIAYNTFTCLPPIPANRSTFQHMRFLSGNDEWSETNSAPPQKYHLLGSLS